MTATADTSLVIPLSRCVLTISLAMCLVVALAGCGGGDEGFTREYIETTTSDAIRDNVARQGGTMDQFTCVEDGDNEHWICIADVRLDDQLYKLTTQVTCDPESRDCISEGRDLSPAG